MKRMEEMKPMSPSLCSLSLDVPLTLRAPKILGFLDSLTRTHQGLAFFTTIIAEIPAV